MSFASEEEEFVELLTFDMGIFYAFTLCWYFTLCFFAFVALNGCPGASNYWPKGLRNQRLNLGQCHRPLEWLHDFLGTWNPSISTSETNNSGPKSLKTKLRKVASTIEVQNIPFSPFRVFFFHMCIFTYSNHNGALPLLICLYHTNIHGILSFRIYQRSPCICSSVK